MPRNKRHVEREVKQQQIEVAATSLFIEKGYDATSMANIAQRADVATNTLYWYYENKDDLLVAVLNRLFSKGLSDYSLISEATIDRQLLWLLNEFEQARTLIALVHARIEHSPQLQLWHQQFHRILESIMVAQLVKQGLDQAAAEIDATVVSYVLEGLLSHPHTPQQQQQIINRLVASYLPT